ncbi:MAG: hypothetical protein K9L82_20200 [Chromatiaceae bacterium]|nr:hypothetical protein [Chromatiaceae bacterium]
MAVSVPLTAPDRTEIALMLLVLTLFLALALALILSTHLPSPGGALMPRNARRLLRSLSQ